jgi:anti-anti-sigma factor
MTTMTLNSPLEPLLVHPVKRLSNSVAGGLEIRLNCGGVVPTASLTGELGGGAAAAVEQLVDDFAAQGVFTLVLDLRRLFLADLAGLAVLRDAAALLHECGGELALADLRPRMRYLLTRTGTAEQFAVYKTVEEAVQALSDDSSGPRCEAAGDLRLPMDPAARPMVPALMSALSHR